MNNRSHPNRSPNNSTNLKPHRLSAGQIEMIEEALASLGDFGEVRLVVEKGRLRFLVTQKSFDALKWKPGLMSRDLEKYE